jgi:hypothetical protein
VSITLEQLINGIRQEESGGNYSVVNSIGAVGAYQVMKGNIPSWTLQALGHSLTWEQYRDSPASQDAVARYKLGSYFNQYGAQGAAAMWFSGQPNYNSSASDGNTSVAKYVANVMSLAGGSSGTSSSSSSTDASTRVTAASIDSQTLAEEYGFTSTFLNANPELKNIFNQAVTGQWSTDKFKASLMNTNWWKSHSDSERTYLTTLATNPGQAKQQLGQAVQHATDLLHQMGVNIPGNQMAQLVSTVAYNIAAKGWTDEQVKYYGGGYVNLVNGRMTGDAETQYSNGLQYAYSMGVTMSSGFYQSAVRHIENGMGTYADLQAAIRNQAKAQYSQFSKQIDAGQTIQDLASPYISQMGNILEVNPQTLSAFDPTIKKALTTKDATSGVSGQPLWQFENTLREDPRWLQTNNARDSLYQTAHSILQNFGKVS